MTGGDLDPKGFVKTVYENGNPGKFLNQIYWQKLLINLMEVLLRELSVMKSYFGKKMA